MGPFAENLSFQGCRFQEYSLFNGTQFNGDANFTGVKFDGGVEFKNSKFRVAEFASAGFGKFVDFSHSEIHDGHFRSSHFVDATFHESQSIVASDRDVDLAWLPRVIWIWDRIVPR